MILMNLFHDISTTNVFLKQAYICFFCIQIFFRCMNRAAGADFLGMFDV